MHYLDFYYLKQSLCWECIHDIFKYCLCRHLTGFWTGANVFLAKFECKRLLALNALCFPTFCSGITLLTVQTHTDRFLICFQRTNDDKTPLGSSCYITSALAGSCCSEANTEFSCRDKCVNVMEPLVFKRVAKSSFRLSFSLTHFLGFEVSEMVILAVLMSAFPANRRRGVS